MGNEKFAKASEKLRWRQRSRGTSETKACKARPIREGAMQCLDAAKVLPRCHSKCQEQCPSLYWNCLQSESGNILRSINTRRSYQMRVWHLNHWISILTLFFGLFLDISWHAPPRRIPTFANSPQHLGSSNAAARCLPEQLNKSYPCKLDTPYWVYTKYTIQYI